MKTKIIKLVGAATLLLVILMLSGCGMGKVSKNTLETDIISSDIIQTIYTSNYTNSSEYKLKECTISKEQINKDDKQDIIFCDVIVENQYFNVITSLQVLYNYYDKGGWILENIMVSNDSIKVSPIAPPEADLIQNTILENVTNKENYKIGFIYNNQLYENYMNTLEFKDFHYDKDTSFSCQLNATSSGSHIVVNGYFQIKFDELSGWELYNFSENKNDEMISSMIVTDVDSDFSSALGKYFINSFSEYSHEFLGSEELIIESINNGKIKYSIGDFSYEADFNPFTYSFELYYNYGETENLYYTYGNCVYYENDYGTGWSLSDYPNTKHISKTVVTDWKAFHTFYFNINEIN